ncbi:hypothetical protein, partial [Agromyces bauzanensis]
MVGILQAVLWCKGYWGGTEFGVWDSDTASAIMEVKADLNLPMTATVPVKLMKTLMTMDAYILVGGGSSKVREVQRYLNGSYWQRLDFGLVPCDGIYCQWPFRTARRRPAELPAGGHGNCPLMA